VLARAVGLDQPHVEIESPLRHRRAEVHCEREGIACPIEVSAN